MKVELLKFVMGAIIRSGSVTTIQALRFNEWNLSQVDGKPVSFFSFRWGSWIKTMFILFSAMYRGANRVAALQFLRFICINLRLLSSEMDLPCDGSCWEL